MNNEIFVTPLTRVYFSQKNIDAVHKAIQYRVYQNHGTRIAKQSDTEVRVIMKSIYFLHAQNLEDKIADQVRCLNKRVIDFAEEQIVTQLKQYTVFQHDHNNLPTLMEHPQNSSTKGDKVLSMDGFI